MAAEEEEEDQIQTWVFKAEEEEEVAHTSWRGGPVLQFLDQPLLV